MQIFINGEIIFKYLFNLKKKYVQGESVKRLSSLS